MRRSIINQRIRNPNDLVKMSRPCELFLKEVESLFLKLQIDSDKTLASAHLKSIIILTLLIEHLQNIYDVKYQLMKAWIALVNVNKVIWKQLVNKVHVAPSSLTQEMVLDLIAQTMNDLSIANPNTHQKLLQIITKYQ